MIDRIDRTELIEAEAWEDDVTAALLELTGTVHLLPKVNTAFEAARILSTFPTDEMVEAVADAALAVIEWESVDRKLLSEAIRRVVAETMIREDDK